MIARTLRCWKCAHEPTPGQFIDGLTAWWPALGVAQHRCPACGGREELQLADGQVVFGYIYAAGTAHFSPEERASVPGLRVWVEGTTLCVEYRDMARKLPASA